MPEREPPALFVRPAVAARITRNRFGRHWPAAQGAAVAVASYRGNAFCPLRGRDGVAWYSVGLIGIRGQSGISPTQS